MILNENLVFLKEIKKMTTKDKMNAIYNVLRETCNIHTKKDIAIKMKASESNVVSAFNGDARFCTKNFLRRMNSAFDYIFSEDWLIHDTGDMLSHHNVIAQTINNGKNVNSGTAQQVGDTTNALDDVVRSQQDVIKQQSEQIGKLIAMLANKL